MRYHSACEDCPMNLDCLLQINNSVEDCEDVREYQKAGEDEEDFIDTTEEEDDEIEED